MTDPLFVSQDKVYTWIDRGEVTFEDNVLTLLEQNVSYRLEPAVRITTLLDGDDVHGWVGKVVTASQMHDAGAEHLSDSVICGDTAYQCEEGFVGQQEAAASPAATATATAPAAAPPPAPEPRAAATPDTEAPAAGEEEANADDMEMLTDFLLKHM